MALQLSGIHATNEVGESSLLYLDANASVCPLSVCQPLWGYDSSLSPAFIRTVSLPLQSLSVERKSNNPDFAVPFFFFCFFLLGKAALGAGSCDGLGFLVFVEFPGFLGPRRFFPSAFGVVEPFVGRLGGNPFSRCLVWHKPHS